MDSMDTMKTGSDTAQNTVSTPDSNGSTTSTQAPAGTPPTPNATNASGAAANPQQVQQQQQQAQAQVQQAQTQQGQQGQQKPQDLSKAPKTPPANGQPMTPQQQQQVQKAGVWHTIAETLAGGPRYTYNVDEYGNTVKTKVPVSNAHLGLVIAMEALQGAAVGLSQQGPNAAGKAAAAGFAAGAQRSENLQKQDQQARENAQTDYKNKMQTTETNLRMYATARQIGKMDRESNEFLTGQFKDMANNLLRDYPGFVEGPVSYKDFGKYNVTLNNAIPYLTVPRLDADGKQVVDKNGIEQWDNQYLIVKPGLKASNLLNEDDIKQLQNMGVLPEGASASLIINTPMQLTQALNLKSQMAQFGVGKMTYGNYYTRVDEMQSGSKEVPSGMMTITPTIPNKPLDQESDKAATKYNVPAALVKGIITTESGGNPNVADSKAHAGGGARGGAIGPMQVMPSTAAQYGITDPNMLRNLRTNVDVGTHYLADLLKNPRINGDPKLAMAAYIGGLGIITEDHKINLSGLSAENKKAVNDYVDKVSKAVGLGLQTTAAETKTGKEAEQSKGTYIGQLNPDTRLSLDEWNKKYPSTRKDNEQFLGMLAHTENNYGQALKELETKDPKAAANMAAFLGGPDGITNHDLSVRIDSENRAEQLKAKLAEENANRKKATDEAAQQEKQDILGSMESATIPNNVLQQDPKDVIANLQSQGVTIPAENIRDAMSVASYDLPLNVASNKLWYKDKSLTQQDVASLVKILNPGYNEGNYTDLKQMNAGNSPASKTIQSATATANHLNELLRLATEVSKLGGATNFPVWNKAKNEFVLQTGGSYPAQLTALTNAINSEMGKVLSGGFAPDKQELEVLRNNMTASNSFQQIKDLVKLYTDVMYDKVKPYDDQYNGLSGAADKHLIIPDSFSQLMRSVGRETPWDTKYLAQQAKQPQPPVPGAIAGRDAQGNIVAWKLPNGSIQQVGPTSPMPDLTQNFVQNQQNQQ
jgi:hypothetical protein